jgi:threonine/homoserine/homoserine lactone efflux protein
MSDPHATATFVMACAAIIVAPGPSQALVLARTIEGGRWAGILTGIGLNVATLVHAALAGAGLSALLTTAAGAFAAVKLVGAAYLCYLGIEALRAAAPVDTAEAARAPTDPAILARAFVTGLLNPKLAVFFLAFLSQFITPRAGQCWRSSWPWAPPWRRWTWPTRRRWCWWPLGQRVPSTRLPPPAGGRGSPEACWLA